MMASGAALLPLPDVGLSEFAVNPLPYRTVTGQFLDLQPEHAGAAAALPLKRREGCGNGNDWGFLVTEGQGEVAGTAGDGDLLSGLLGRFQLLDRKSVV